MKAATATPFVSFWRTRDSREQVLLLSLAALIAVLTAVYGVVAPLRAVAARAQAHQTRAAETLGNVRAAIAEIALAKGIAQLPAGGLEEAVMASAAASGMMLEPPRTDTPREIVVSANDADPAALFNWIALLQQAHGITVTNLTATRNQDGSLHVEARFAGTGP